MLSTLEALEHLLLWLGDRDPLDFLVTLGDAEVFLCKLGDRDSLLPTLGRGGVSTICTSSSEPEEETVAE